MDLRKIKKLIDLLEESNLAEIEIKEGEESVRLARVPQGGPAGRRAGADARSTAPRAAAGHADELAGRRPPPAAAPSPPTGPAGRPRGARADGRHLLRLARRRTSRPS